MQGRISKNDIDARMLKALADLPVDLGIEAVDKFAMASLDSVRSKTGFMVSGCMCPWMVTGINRTQALTALLWRLTLTCWSWPADGHYQAYPGGSLRTLPRTRHL